MNIFNVELFDIFYNFFIYAFLGWIYESCYVSLNNKNWVNRGFLNGPIIPIYGAGATLIYISFWQYREQYLLIFFGGMILATLLEYVTSLLMELIFHAKWWDYGHIKFNIHGRVCLSVSLFWGGLSLLMIEFIQPRIVKILDLIPKTYGEYIAYAIVALVTTDLTVTVVHTLQLNKMLSELQRLKQEFYDYIESTRLYETKEEWKHRFASYKINDLVENIKTFVEENKEKLIEINLNREGFELKKLRFEIEKQVKDYFNKFQTKTSRTSRIQKRLLKAFPNIQFIKREDALKDLRERLQKYKKK